MPRIIYLKQLIFFSKFFLPLSWHNCSTFKIVFHLQNFNAIYIN